MKSAFGMKHMIGLGFILQSTYGIKHTTGLGFISQKDDSCKNLNELWKNICLTLELASFFLKW